MVKKVCFTIDAQGEVHVDVQGAVGAQCDTLTEPFESLLGTVSSKERKDSFYASTESTVQESTAGESRD